MGNAMSAMSREEREEERAQRIRERLANGGKAIVDRDALLALIASIDAVERIDATLVNWVDHEAVERLRGVLK